MLYHTSVRHRPSLLASAALLTLISAPSALAQDGAAAPSAQELEDDFHNRQTNNVGEIVVTATGLEQLDILAGSSVIEGVELQRELDGQLGSVLEKLPGVASTGFAPGASRPVIRGFSGERVKVLIDGIGAIDASNTSDDHAVSVDPLTIERIEVLRGPAVILYGSQAIGGAVNVIDKRIPSRVPDEAFHLDTILSADTATGLLEGGASLDVPLGPNFVIHANGSYRNTDDIEVGGFTNSAALRAELLEEAAEEEDEGEFEEAEEFREAAAQRGVLPNSATETWNFDVGFAFIDGDSNLGAAFGIYDTSYGVPGRPGTGHHHGEEGEEGEGEAEEEEGEEVVTIGLRQERADMRAELALGEGFFSKLRTRVGYSNYTHTEFEGDEIGTVFDVQGIEARLELIQTATERRGGSFGFQYTTRDFEAIGEEAFVAPNRTNQFAMFGLQEFNFGPVQLEGALRYEKTDVSSNTLNVERDFDAVSGALSLAYETQGGLRFGITGSRAERAPAAEELFANGPHIATQQFEIGDTTLNKEKSWGAEAFVRGSIGPATVNFAVFKSWYDDFIYLSATGEEEDDLPVFQIVQNEVTYSGIEGEISVPLINEGPVRLIADLRGDYIKAELEDGTPVPRIPALNFLGALEAQTGPVDIRGEVQWFDDQNDVAPFETATDGFTLVNASVSWRPFVERPNVTLMVQADNIFDVIGRRHTSFTKDYVPVVGRNFRVSLRTSF